MKAVRVQYTVKPEYVAQNIKNIKAVMDAIQANPIEGMYYSTYQLPDGVSFMHLNIAVDGETMNKLNDVEAFTIFRTGLKASEPVSPPKAEDLEFVGSSVNLF
jgi:hypothetical protein